MNLHQRYERRLTEQGWSADPAQIAAVDALEALRVRLVTPRPRGFLARLAGQRSTDSVAGVYLWGGVGRGKTFLMDLFFESLPFDERLRFHFHRIMYRVHIRLKELKNTPDPLETVASELANRARVLCFDEFFVSDITDAMILGRLLDALFEKGVTLVSTSNIPPQDLYQDGLQRQNFLPAIQAIEAHTQVINVDGPHDYRLRVLEQAEIYHSPLDEEAETNLLKYFSGIAPDEGTSDQDIEILGRNIRTRRRADGVAWFDFVELVDGPRSQNDYIELARTFQTVLISGMPVMDASHENQARRFVALVDEFYDRRVKIILSAAAPPEAIYTGALLQFEFQRTISRLQEMQSHEYLAEPHRP